MNTHRMHGTFSICLWIGIIAAGISPSDSFANNDDTHFFEMSLEELMNVEIDTASILTLKSVNAPASITTITREDIAVTPARNIIDLINTYVPGAMSQAHTEGPKIGVRGIITSNNLKYLLLVNGRNINEKTKLGVVSEVDQWNLNDIEKIEIIRGPGSVTHGPGAVGGVIRITTKTSETFTGTRVGLLANTEYRSQGGFFEYGFRDGDFGLYAFASVQETDGEEDSRYYESHPTTESYYAGVNTGVGASDYLADPLGKPQIKIHLDMDFGDHWRWWTRYTQSGQTWAALGSSTRRETTDGLKGPDKVSHQGFISTLTHAAELSNGLSVSSMISFDSHNIEIYTINSPSYSENSLLNRKFSFSENEVFLRSIVSAEISDKLQIAIGGEYSYDWVRSPWNEDKDRFFVKEGLSLISGDNSEFSGDGNDGTVDPDGEDTLFVDDGWESDMISLLLEADYQLKPNLKVLASMRYDKHSLADGNSSPRAAFIYSPDSKNTFKLIAQRSVRLMRSSGLYISDEIGTDVEPETLETYELNFSRIQNPNLQFGVNAFYNDLSVIAYTNEKSTNVGESKTAGIELEAKYQKSRLMLGFNHSFVKQLDFEMDDALKTGSSKQGISTADYYYEGEFITLTSEGNDLNNWHNQSSKFFVTYKLSNNWTLHANAVMRWGMEGAKDELSMYEKAYAAVDIDTLSPDDQAVFLDEKENATASIEGLRKKDAYEEDVRINASASYNFAAWQSDMSLRLYLHNLMRINDSRSYLYSTGSNDYYPNRAGFVEEPFSVSLQFTANF